MTSNMKLMVALLGATATAGAALVTTGAADPGGFSLTPLTAANPRSDGLAPADRFSPELTPVIVAQGATRVENPSAVASFYAYNNDVLNAGGDPQMVPTPTQNNEATKTEPDKNTYLAFDRGLPGADDNYDYGRRFLFQGHENGAGYLTRINLDADAAHRVTVLATKDADGNPITTIDGSTWDPFARRLILTTESPSKPTYAATPGYPSVVTDVSGALGRGGYEGVQSDGDGNLWLVEDIGGAKKAGTNAKVPNSFVYRYVPARPGDLAHGRLQALQVTGDGGQPITQATQTAIDAPDQVALHTYGKSFKTTWVTVHDTAVDGSAPFNANDAAKAHGATPFKRPENGVFRPGSRFREFFFTVTGDTNTTSPEWTSSGGAGAIMKLSQPGGPSAPGGTLTMFYKSDTGHAGLDNIQFLTRDVLGAVEDAGDTLHGQRNALDSAYAFDVRADYGAAGAPEPVRFMAEGRDASATIDAANGGFGRNDGDNEITGLTVSDGDPTPAGILGAKSPNLRDGRWDAFVTRQHGDNVTYELRFADRRGED